MKTIATFFLLLIALFRVSAQQIYYVSPTGNDNSSDPTNINTPWKTFSKACITASAGSKVYFRGGTYNETGIIFPNSVANNNYIEFLNFPNEIPVFDGGNANAYFINISNFNYVKINGLHFKKLVGTNYGIKIEGTSHHIEIRNCQFSELYFSSIPTAIPSPTNNFNPIIFCGSNSTTSINNVIVDNCNINNCRTGFSEALTFVGNVDRFIASNNHINNTGNIGIVAAGYYNWCNNSPTNSQARNGIIRGNLIENCKGKVAIAAGIYVDGGKNIIIEQNICRNGQRGFQINCENHHNIVNARAENIIIRNNLAINNSRGGIGLGTCFAPSGCNNGKVTNSWIINNTTVSNYNSAFEVWETVRAEDFGELNLDYSENCVIKNNIFFSTALGRDRLMNGYSETEPVNLSMDNNIWFDIFDSTPYFVYFKVPYDGLLAFQTNKSKDIHSIFQNPNFINNSTDFRLSSESSPAYNFGESNTISIDSAGTKDLANKTRMINQLPDAGAYEFQCPSTDISVNAPLTYKTYLFQTNQRIFINKTINPNIRAVFNAKKSVLFQAGASSSAFDVLQTKTDGCTN